MCGLSEAVPTATAVRTGRETLPVDVSRAGIAKVLPTSGGAARSSRGCGSICERALHVGRDAVHIRGNSDSAPALNGSPTGRTSREAAIRSRAYVLTRARQSRAASELARLEECTLPG